jgi:response regulator RpfG family c-di-GMP phosphodiesterase
MVKKSTKQNKIKTVLFIDDEPMWLEAVRLSLMDEKFKIITANDGETALKKLHQKKPDLIMSDVRMPNMNGFDLFLKVKSDPKFKNVPYVFMSSIDDYDAKKTAKELGANGYIEKPFDSEQIKNVIVDFLSHLKSEQFGK